jgi:hypothetical protein
LLACFGFRQKTYWGMSIKGPFNCSMWNIYGSSVLQKIGVVPSGDYEAVVQDNLILKIENYHLKMALKDIKQKIKELKALLNESERNQWMN